MSLPKPTPHPLLPWFTLEQLQQLAAMPDGAERCLAAYHAREEAIRLSLQDPLQHCIEPVIELPDGQVVRPWEDIRELEQDPEVDIIANFGGNRSMKSYGALLDLARNIKKYPGATFVCLHEDVTTSIEQQQRVLWSFLEPHFKAVNFKKDPRHKFWVHYSDAGGFSDRKAIFPHPENPNKVGSKLFFFTYNEDPGDIEGWEFGSKDASIFAVHLEESCSLPWLKMFARRLKFSRAKARWTFTAVNGITPAMKELLGKTARTDRSLPAELLPLANIPGCERGHMPYIQTPEMPRTKAIYFHSCFNQFWVGKPDPATGKGISYWEQIKKDCVDSAGRAKATFYVERIAYGYARDSVSRAFPLFGPWNIVPESALPEVGTNYRFIDPAGDKNWFVVWARVTPGNPPDIYIYRDWPDAQSYGEWAVPTSKAITSDQKTGWDGDPGPAQVHTADMPSGWVGYKRMMLEVETVREGEVDPYRRKKAEGGMKNGEVLREEIFETYMDPRAGRNPQQEATGSTSLIDEMNNEQRDDAGTVIGPMMQTSPASGIEPAFRVDAINELLRWDPEKTGGKPVLRFNAPRLFVSDRCQQVIWALSNYTGRGGEQGAAKDPVDCVGYLAKAPVWHVEPGKESRGGGCY